MKIWRTRLERQRVQDIKIPAFAKILSTGFKDDAVQIWYQCRPENQLVSRRILVSYTGVEEVPDDDNDGVFIGTVVKPNGIVLHVFEIPAD